MVYLLFVKIACAMNVLPSMLPVLVSSATSISSPHSSTDNNSSLETKIFLAVLAICAFLGSLFAYCAAICDNDSHDQTSIVQSLGDNHSAPIEPGVDCEEASTLKKKNLFKNTRGRTGLLKENSNALKSDGSEIDMDSIQRGNHRETIPQSTELKYSETNGNNNNNNNNDNRNSKNGLEDTTDWMRQSLAATINNANPFLNRLSDGITDSFSIISNPIKRYLPVSTTEPADAN